jgi:hypothetical protein
MKNSQLNQIITTLIYSSIFILTIMNTAAQNNLDNSNKSILARGCDPTLSSHFAKIVPPLIGNAEYVATTDDYDFINKLKSRKWSVIYFAPGACRYDAAERQIPGGNVDTQNWSLEQYKQLILKLQGEEIQIVESIYENGAIELLNNALIKGRSVK